MLYLSIVFAEGRDEVLINGGVREVLTEYGTEHFDELFDTDESWGLKNVPDIFVNLFYNIGSSIGVSVLCGIDLRA